MGAIGSPIIYAIHRRFYYASRFSMQSCNFTHRIVSVVHDFGAYFLAISCDKKVPLYILVPLLEDFLLNIPRIILHVENYTDTNIMQYNASVFIVIVLCLSWLPPCSVPTVRSDTPV